MRYEKVIDIFLVDQYPCPQCGSQIGQYVMPETAYDMMRSHARTGPLCMVCTEKRDAELEQHMQEEAKTTYEPRFDGVEAL